MLINFGSLRGKKIEIGKNAKMRPTTGKAKSIIFNTLNIDSSDSVIDVFAGTGSLGFEAKSLGASKVYFADVNIFSYLAIKKNIINFNFNKDDVKVFKTDFRRFLTNIDFKPSIIFLDPPFIAKHYYDEALEIIYKNNLLKNDGFIVLEKLRKDEVKNINNFLIYKQRKVGEMEIFFLKNKES